MWLEAILTERDIEHALRALAPIQLALGAYGSVLIESPSRVELVAGRGLRAVCPATVHGSLFGMDVPVSVAAASVFLEPLVAERSGEDALVFNVTLESIDVSALPHLAERAVVDAVNAALLRPENELVWDFRGTLSHTFPLPDVIRGVREVDVAVAWGELRVTKDALVFAVSIHAAGRGDDALIVVAPTRQPSR